MRWAVWIVPVLAACGGGAEGARAVDHHAVYATPNGVWDLALAVSPDRGAMLSWTEGELGSGDPMWLALADDRAPAHHAAFVPLDSDEESVDRVWSDLFALGDSFVRLVARGTTLDELTLEPDGSLRELETQPFPYYAFLESVSFPAVQAATLGSQLLVGKYEQSLQGVRLEAQPVASGEPDVPPAVALADVGECALQFLMVTLDADSVAVLHGECVVVGESVAIHPVVTTIDLGPQGTTTQSTRSEQPVFVLDDLGVVRVPVEMLAVGGGLVSLWLGIDGSAAVYSQPSPTEMRFEEPVFDTGGEPAAMTRLLATRDRAILAYRIQEDDRLSSTRAVVIDPASGEVDDDIDWPVPDDCPIESHVSSGTGLEYTCTSRCQGAGCAEHWIFRGRVELTD